MQNARNLQVDVQITTLRTEAFWQGPHRIRAVTLSGT